MIAFACAVALDRRLRPRPPRAPPRARLRRAVRDELRPSSTRAHVAGARRAAARHAAPRRPPPARSPSATLGALVGGWVATGQSLGAIDDYVRGSLEIVSGYSEAMCFEDPTRAGSGAAFLVIGIGFAVAWHAAELLPRRGAARAGGAVGGARVHDLQGRLRAPRPGAREHLLRLPARRPRRVRLGSAPAPDRVAARRAVRGRDDRVGAAGAARPRPPVTRAGKLAEQARPLARPRRPPRDRRRACRADRHYEQLDARFVQRWAGGPCTSSRSTRAGLGANLRWQPLPVFQSYSAYTRSSTTATPTRRAIQTGRRRSCARRRSRSTTATRRSSRPRRCARSSATSAPRARRSAAGSCSSACAPRCGAERPLKTVKAKLGVPAAVPPRRTRTAPSFVRIDGIEVKGLEKLRATLYRALQRRSPSTAAHLPPRARDGRRRHRPARPGTRRLPQAVRARPGHEHDHRGQVRAPGRPAAPLLLDVHPLAWRPDARVHRHRRGGAAVRPRAGRLAGLRRADRARARRARGRAARRRAVRASCARATSRACSRGGCSGAHSTPPRATSSRACSRTSARRCCWPATCSCWSRSTTCPATTSPSCRACSSRSRARRCSRTGCSTPA